MTDWDVSTLGEGGLRLSTPAGIPLERADSLDVAIAGAEANVASSLAGLGWRAAWASVLPDSPMGRRVTRELHSNSVDTSLVRIVPEGRVGVYFVEYGAAPRPTSVHFDRKDTALALIRPAQVDWDRLLDTTVLHLTGITAAVSDAAGIVVQEAARRARSSEALLSFDVNFRARMWSLDAARGPLTSLIEAADIVFIRQPDARLLFGTESSAESLEAVRARSSARWIAVTDGASGAHGWIDGTTQHAQALDVRIVDRLGAGDAFAAGFLHRILAGDDGTALHYGAALAALSLAQTGEQVTTTCAELDRLVTAPTTDLDR